MTFFLFLFMSSAPTPEGQQRLQTAVPEAISQLPESPALSVGFQLLTNPLPLLGGRLTPKPIVRILITDEKTELKSEEVVTCTNSEASSGRWAEA